MRILSLSIVFAGIWVSSAGQAARADEPRWHKGNTHTHSFWSDGNDFQETIALWYREHGYDFLVFSDHNALSDRQRWMKVADVDRRSEGKAMGKYAAKLGKEWVELRGEGAEQEVRLKTLDETRKAAQTPRFLVIQGEEISDVAEKKPIHYNAMNLAELIGPQGGKDIRDTMRRNLAAVQAQAQRLHRPILPHLNHPNFGYAVTAEDIAHVLEEEFFEVYNGAPIVAQEGDAYHPPVERLWDIANTIRIAQLKAPPLYGVATDDTHHYHDNPGQHHSPGRGWIMVRAGGLTADALIHAMRDGNFYASSGVSLAEVKFDGRTLSLEVESQGDAQYTTQFIGTLEGFDPAVTPKQDAKGHSVTGGYSTDVGKVLQAVNGPKASYTLTGKELYVRAVVTSSRPHDNPSFKGQHAQAWTQPVGWERRVDEKATKLHFHRHD